MLTWTIKQESNYTELWLNGKRDHIVYAVKFSVFDLYYATLYSRVYERGDDGVGYVEAKKYEFTGTEEEVMVLCEQKLMQMGLIDVLWWATQ